MTNKEKIERISEMFNEASSSEFFYCLLDHVDESNVVTDDLFQKLEDIWKRSAP